MHPLLRGRLRIALYFVVWIGVAGAVTTLLALLTPRPAEHAMVFAGPLTLFYAVACLSAWWVCRSRPIAATPPLRLLGGLAGASLLSGVLWAAAGGIWGSALFRLGGIGDRTILLRDLGFLLPAGTLLYAQSLAAHYFVLAFETARDAERRLLESQVGAREAELRALRAQLNPHFLFNSLNSISALTGADPEAARSMCHLLGEFLRTSLALGARDRVAVSEELALARRYLAVEQVRFGPRLEVEVRADPEAEACLVPPLLIQPLVENAVKHGVADRVEGGRVSVAAVRRGGSLVVTVENPRDPDAPSRRGQGLGLDIVRQRLAAIDPLACRVEVLNELDRFRVALTLPAIEAGGEDSDGG